MYTNGGYTLCKMISCLFENIYMFECIGEIRFVLL